MVKHADSVRSIPRAQGICGGHGHSVRRPSRSVLPLAVALCLCPLGSVAMAGVVTSGASGASGAPGAPAGTPPAAASSSPESILNSVIGGSGASGASGASGTSTSTTSSTAPAETPAQKAAIQAEEARLAAEQAQQNARIERENEQSHQSLNGMGGRYYLPPLPGPAYVRPMVGTQYQEEFPLSTREIQWVKHQMQDDQYAIHKGAPLQIENPSLPVSLGPGAQVPTIHLAPGYVTTISVIGENGSPWPVTSRQVGGGSSFSVSAVSQDEGAPRGVAAFSGRSAGASRAAASTARGASAARAGKESPAQGTSSSSKPRPVQLPSNLLTISPKYFGSSSNLVLTLKGVSTPLMINVVADGPHDKTVDGMVTLRVDRHGPEAPPPLYAPPPPSAVNTDLMLFLSQTPPQGARPLHASGGFGVKAWSWNHRVIVRTRIPLLSPAWTAEVRQDGAMVYDLPKTRVLMLRDDLSAASSSWQMRTVLLSDEASTTVPSASTAIGGTNE